MYDIIVVGGGPAGLTAALYALRNGKTALVIEQNVFGGQITHSPLVENYPGLPAVSGNEWAEKLLDQVLAQGADIEMASVSAVEDQGDYKTVRTREGGAFQGRAVILATGVKHRMLGLEGEEALVGQGISFCAVCDGGFFEGKRVCVAGGGNSALQEALLLAEHCSQVTVLQDLPHYTGEQRLQDALFRKPNVKLKTGVKITGLRQENGLLTGVDVQAAEGRRETLPCDGLFVAIGLIPQNQPFAALAALDNWGYFDSDEGCRTRTPGIYVAGDCRRKAFRQLTTALADGASAALNACRDMQEKQ